MEYLIGRKVLVTTQDWFYGKNGVLYRAIHGTLKGIHEAKGKVGFVPNRAHANWFYEIGDMIVMGCQIMYLQQVDEVHSGETPEYITTNGKCEKIIRPSQIYITE